MHNQDLIKKWEALKLEAYLPTPNDVWTIGWGHTKGVHKGMKITRDQAQAYFDSDIKWASDAVDELVKVPLTVNQRDALISFVFNIGRTAFSRSTMLRKLNAGDYEGAAAEFPRWNKQKGVVLRGLTRRRAEEMKYFMGVGVPGEVEEGPQSASVDPAPELKPITLSKELASGVALIVTAFGGFFADLNELAQNIAVGTITGVVALVGAFVIINRLNARRKGQR